jgi:3-hydroxyacyl-[acyl-carrier-protein] dehydratase
MRFVLVDRILELVPGQSIVTEKALTLAEEYLGDHFPSFPVMPGVLMVEAMVQSAAWLVRASTDFAASIIVLKQARNISYKSFVPPGQILTVNVQARNITQAASEFVGQGRTGERQVVKARFALTHSNLAEQDPALADVDRRVIQRQRELFGLLGGSTLARSAATVQEPTR